jgi:hypothetical protein
VDHRGKEEVQMKTFTVVATFIVRTLRK